MLVEDELIIAVDKAMKLEQHGYRALTTHSGEKAIELIETTPEIDLVLMDIDLGKGINGIQTAEKILQIKELPIIFLSSHIEDEIIKKTERVSTNVLPLLYQAISLFQYPLTP
ncbi:MAG: response regulator [Flavobacteriales bacterium]|nr:response regulator [Flavobacteriales bacterium]